jgi:hypothetical protein
MPPHVHLDFVVSPPGCGRSVTDFWGLGTHREQVRCPDDVSDDMYVYMYMSVEYQKGP